MPMKKETLQGLIVANDFDSVGNPVRFALLTEDENKYLVEPGSREPELAMTRYNRKQVRLSGEIRLDRDRKIVTVNDIKILPLPE